MTGLVWKEELTGTSNWKKQIEAWNIQLRRAMRWHSARLTQCCTCTAMVVVPTPVGVVCLEVRWAQRARVENTPGQWTRGKITGYITGYSVPDERQPRGDSRPSLAFGSGPSMSAYLSRYLRGALKWTSITYSIFHNTYLVVSKDAIQECLCTEHSVYHFPYSIKYYTRGRGLIKGTWER